VYVIRATFAQESFISGEHLASYTNRYTWAFQ